MDKLITALRNAVQDEGFAPNYCSRGDLRALVRDHEAPVRKRLATTLRALRRFRRRYSCDNWPLYFAELTLDSDRKAAKVKA